MHDALQKEIALYEKRTPKSAEAHKKAEKRIPLGVASNYRAYDPYPIFVAEGHGGKIKDIDGNEYIDHNLCFGTLMAGHGHPAVVKAVQWALANGTTFGMPHGMEAGTGGGNLCAVSGGDGAIRVQRHGSDDARLPDCASGDGTRQNSAFRRLLSRTARHRAGQRETEGRRLRRYHAPNSVPGGLGVIQVGAG